MALILDILLLILFVGVVAAVLIFAARRRSLMAMMVVISLIGVVMAIAIPAALRARPSSEPADPRASSRPQGPRPANTQVIELSAAVAAQAVEFTLQDVDLSFIDLKLKLRGTTPLEVVVSPGTLFLSPSTQFQNMVVRSEQRVVLASNGAEASLVVDVACVNMHRDVPGAQTKLTIATTPASGDLLTLLRSPAFSGQSFRIQQFAIWTISDNPPRDEYVGISSFGAGGFPSEAELQSVRDLLLRAGIDVRKYRAIGG